MRPVLHLLVQLILLQPAPPTGVPDHPRCSVVAVFLFATTCSSATRPRLLCRSHLRHRRTRALKLGARAYSICSTVFHDRGERHAAARTQARTAEPLAATTARAGLIRGRSRLFGRAWRDAASAPGLVPPRAAVVGSFEISGSNFLVKYAPRRAGPTNPCAPAAFVQVCDRLVTLSLRPCMQARAARPPEQRRSEIAFLTTPARAFRSGAATAACSRVPGVVADTEAVDARRSSVVGDRRGHGTSDSDPHCDQARAPLRSQIRRCDRTWHVLPACRT